MSEYISRDYAMKEMHAIVKRYQSPVETGLALCAMITGAPAADVAPVVHGQWETYAYVDGFVCAVCSSCKWNSGAMWWGYAIKHFDFCPHCGAKMDESEE